MTMDESLPTPLYCNPSDLSNSNSKSKSQTQMDRRRAGHQAVVELESLKLGVLGTGNFATAFARRLVSKGYRVVIGSRKPSARRGTLNRGGNCLCGVEVTTVQECIRSCDVIIVAIHMENFVDTLQPFSEMFRGKILVDVSNREKRYASRSNAEYLSSLLPKAKVVKAFNTVSAQLVENDSHISSTVSGGQKVFVAGDDKIARNTISDLARSLGFQAVDFGALKNSIQLEDFVLKVFPGWKIPIFLAFGIFNLWSLYIIYIYFVDKTAYKWDQLFLKVLNKPVCMTAITMLALTYLPGQIASVLQTWRGTKHSRFPRVLDTWLKSKKQFGLIAFFLVVFHVIASALMLSPTYYKSWFHHPAILFTVTPENYTILLTNSGAIMSPISLPVPPTSWMVWKGELALLFGISAFLTMSIQAITSIPSVGSILNWSEWRCVQANLGTFVLVLSSCHVISMGAPGWLKVGPIKTLGSITFLCLILPVLVLLIKFAFRCPPLFCYIRKIRRGWEREKNDFDVENNKNKNGYSDSSDKLLIQNKPNVTPKKPCCRPVEKGREDEESESLVKLEAIDEEVMKDCCGGGKDDNIVKVKVKGKGCGCNDQFEGSEFDSGDVLRDGGGRCGCAGDCVDDNDSSINKTTRNKNYVRFAVNTNCDCSSV